MADEPSPKSNSNEDQTAGASKGGGWFSWYNDAKAKTLTTLDLVKRDLVEFRDSVGQQATTTLSSVMPPAAQQAPQMLGDWVKGLAQTVNEAMLKMGDTTFGEEIETEVIVGKEKGHRSKSFVNGKLFMIESDLGTFLNEPSGAPELFEDWLDHFSIKDKELEIEYALEGSAVLTKSYTDLVPSTISRTLFWSRYFYKIHQFELEDEVKERSDEKRIRHEPVKHKLSSNDSDEVSWGDDSDLDELSTLVSQTCVNNNNNNSQPTNDTPDHIDEKLATAVLEREDMEQKLLLKDDQPYRKAKSDCSDVTTNSSVVDNKSSVTPSDVLSLSDSSETIPSNENESDIDQTAISCPNDKPSPALDVELKNCTVNNNKTVISPSLDEELCSEQSFCMITSSGSSFNGDALPTQR